MQVRALYFSADWCLPCKTFKPLAKEALDNARINMVEYDVDNHNVAQRFGIMSLPTIVFQEGLGVEYMRVVGASMKQLKEALDYTYENYQSG